MECDLAMANADELFCEGGCLCGQLCFRVGQPQKEAVDC